MKKKDKRKLFMVGGIFLLLIIGFYLLMPTEDSIYIGKHPNTGGACDSYDQALIEATNFEAGKDYNIFSGIIEPGIPNKGTCVVVNLGRVGCYSCNDLKIDSTDPNRNSAAYCGDMFEVTVNGVRQDVSTRCSSDIDCNLIAGAVLSDERVYQCGDRATFPSYMPCVDGFCKSYYRPEVVTPVVEEPIPVIEVSNDIIDDGGITLDNVFWWFIVPLIAIGAITLLIIKRIK